MAVYVVTWNINKAGTAYDEARAAFLKHLERYDNVKDDSLETVRWVSTTIAAGQLSDDLRQKLDDNDRLFVSQLFADRYAGWLAKSVWEWIRVRL
jgi:hypothetical protein